MKTITILAVLILPLFVLTACTNNTKDNTKAIVSNKTESTSIPVLQTNRYTIVELDDPLNKYVLDQIINISLPKNVNLTVQGGMNYVLNQSGYSLCDSDIVLYRSYLPKVHYKIGPISVQNALLVMAGPAWDLVIDDVEREVCFQLKKGYFSKKQIETNKLEENRK